MVDNFIGFFGYKCVILMFICPMLLTGFLLHGFLFVVNRRKVPPKSDLAFGFEAKSDFSGTVLHVTTDLRSSSPWYLSVFIVP